MKIWIRKFSKWEQLGGSHRSDWLCYIFEKTKKQKTFSCLWLPACFSQTHWARSVGPCCGSRGAPADSAWVATLESAASPPAGHSIAKKRANHHKGSPPGLPVLHPHRLDFLHLLHRPDPRLRGKTRTVSPELWRAEVGRQRQWMALLPSVMTSSAGYLRFLRLPAERKKKKTTKGHNEQSSPIPAKPERKSLRAQTTSWDFTGTSMFGM